jgi:hypothetical protein
MKGMHFCLKNNNSLGKQPLFNPETSDTYSSDHTYDQLRAFDSAGNYWLEVVVPQSVYDAARRLYLVLWKISVDFWQTFKF